MSIIGGECQRQGESLFMVGYLISSLSLRLENIFYFDVLSEKQYLESLSPGSSL